MTDDRTDLFTVVVWCLLALAAAWALLAVADCREDSDREKCERHGGRHVRIESVDPTERHWTCVPKVSR